MTTPKVGLPGQLVSSTGAILGPVMISAVHSDGTVDVQNLVGSATTSIPFTDVGGTPPASKHFQAIDTVA